MSKDGRSGPYLHSYLRKDADWIVDSQRPLYNPAGIEVVTHEILHSPQAFDPRGGPTTADHVSPPNETIDDSC